MDQDHTRHIDGSQDSAHLVFRTRPTGKDRFSGSYNTIRLDLDHLKAQFVVPFRVAAVRLGVCETALKKLDRVTFSNARAHRTYFWIFSTEPVANWASGLGHIAR